MHLIVLLSALLASLTGLVAGERPAERAQVEFSAAASAVQADQAELAVEPAPAREIPALVTVLAVLAMVAAAPVRSLRTRLSLRQSWLN